MRPAALATFVVAEVAPASSFNEEHDVMLETRVGAGVAIWLSAPDDGAALVGAGGWVGSGVTGATVRMGASVLVGSSAGAAGAPPANPLHALNNTAATATAIAMTRAGRVAPSRLRRL